MDDYTYAERYFESAVYRKAEARRIRNALLRLVGPGLFGVAALYAIWVAL